MSSPASMSAYYELSIQADPFSNGQWYSLWTDDGDGMLMDMATPGDLSVTYGQGQIPQIEVSFFVKQQFVREVLSSKLFNAQNLLRCRIHDPVAGVSSPVYQGFTTKPGINLTDGGVEITVQAQGVSGALRELSSTNGFAKKTTVKGLLAKIFKDLGIEDKLVFEATDVGLLYDVKFGRSNVWSQVLKVLKDHGMFVFESPEAGDVEMHSSGGQQTICVRDVPGASEQKTKKILRWYPGAQLGKVENDEILPLLGLSCDPQHLFAPGFGRNVRFASVNRLTGQWRFDDLDAAQETHTSNHGGKAAYTGDDARLPGLAKTAKELRSLGYFGGVLGAPEDDGQKDPGIAGARGAMTEADRFGAGLTVEIETVGVLVDPGEKVYVDGIVDWLDGEYVAWTMRQSVGDSAWTSTISAIKPSQPEDMPGTAPAKGEEQPPAPVSGTQLSSEQQGA
jgi:hypothetical protein